MTTEIALLPSCNRGFPKILDHDGSGLVAYGARDNIYVFDLRRSPPTLLDSMVLVNSHRSKVLSVSFCKSNNRLLASVGEDGVLKIWDLEKVKAEDKCIYSLEVKDVSRVVEWLYDSKNTVVYPEKNGYVSKCNFETKILTRMKTSSDSSAYVLSSNKNSPELLAVGHCIGSISILNVNTQELVYKLKTHSLEIKSLSWSPVSPLMLLSVSLDQSARLWKLGEDKPINTFYYPTSRVKMDDKKRQKFCGVCHPENPNVIICSNVRGDVGAVTFTENEVPKFMPYCARSSDNFKTVYGLVPYYTDDKKHLVLTVDFNKISLWDVSKEKLLSSYNFIIGNIKYLALSTNNPSLLAVCSEDGFLRIWNVISEATKMEMSSIYIDYRVKVTCAAWHPTEENIIAYGCIEGRVGIIDIYKKKVLYSYETHLSNTCYSLQWGPCSKLKASKEQLFLYSVGGGQIFIYELHKVREKPADFDTLITLPPDSERSLQGCSELCWKPDYTCLAVGYYKGFVDLFDNELKFLTRLTLQMKNVECLRWHPAYTFSSPDGSKYSSWLAAAGNDNKIHIFDATDVIKRQSESVPLKSTRTLGHEKRVYSICWSPHNDGFLVSASRDGTVQVWNAITVTRLAVYPWHKDIIYAAQWSHFDPDIIYSGGMDCCLRIWKISEQSQTISKENFKLAKHKAYKIKEKDSDRKETRCEDVNSQQKESSTTKTNNNRIPEASETITIEDSIVETSTKKTSKLKQEASISFKQQLKNLFPDMVAKLYSKEECMDDIFKLTDILCDQDHSDSQNTPQIFDKVTSEESLKFGFFADQFTALKMLETRANSELIDGSFEKATILQTMACNVVPILTDAAEKKKLTDFLVASAPSVSYQFWHEMCEKYAMQLVEEQNFMKASMYFLLCGKLYEAIKMLLEKGKFLEALALAKARLPEADPFLQNVHCKVANQFAMNRLVVSEASCYLAIKEPLQAAKILYCTANSKHIYASAYICSKFNLVEEAETYGYFCIEKCLSQNDWPTFYKVAEVVNSLEIYKVLVRVHEILSIHMKEIKKEDEDKIFGATGSKLLIWEGKTYKDSNLSFLGYIYETLKSEGILLEDKKSLEQIREAVDLMDKKREKYEISAEVHVSVAIYVTQVIVTSLLGDLHLATKYFLKIFSASYNIVFLPRVMCSLFLPLNLYWCTCEDTFFCENKIRNIEISPLTTHFQDIYMLVCSKFASIGKSDPEDFTVFECISSNLNSIVQKVLSILSKKTTEDSLLLYFSAFYLNELRKHAKKGWKFRCYTVTSDNKFLENIVHDNRSSINDTKSVEQNTSLVECVPEQTEDCQNEVEENSNNATSPDDIKVEDVHKNKNFKKNAECNVQNTLTCVSMAIDQCQNIVEKSSNEVVPLDVIDNEVKDVHLDEDAKNGIKDVEQGASLMEYVGQNEECQKSVTENSNEAVPLDVIHNEVGVISENGNVKNDVKSVEQSISSMEYGQKHAEQCQNGLKETSNAISSLDVDGDKTKEYETVTEDIDKIKSCTSDIKVDSETNIICLENEDDHLQCWTDISLYYVVTKCFISALCKDDYALLFYLQKRLQQLDRATADLARQKSTKTVVNSSKNSNSKCNGSKDNSSTDQKTVAQETGSHSDTLNSEIVTNSEENKCDSNSADSNKMQENEISSDKTKSEVTTDSEDNKYDTNGNTVQENEASADKKNDNVLKPEVTVYNEENKCNTNIPNGSVMQDIEVSVNNEDDIQSINNEMNLIKLENKISCINQTDGHDKISCVTSTEDKEREVNSFVPVEISQAGLSSQETISKKIQAEHKEISEQIMLLNSKEFCYPNPFDAVSALNGICCDIFHKHPCNLVKAKFHELAHEVNKWSTKFCTKDEILTCAICHEKMSI